MGSTNNGHFSFRPMALEDVPRISDWFLDIDDMAFFDRALPIPVNAEALRESWRASLEYSVPPSAYWVVAEDPEGNPAGVSGLQSISYIHGDAIVPAFIAEPYRDLGLGPAMVSHLIDLAFNQMRLHRLTTFYRADNGPAENSLAKVGFAEEGRFREGWFANGKRNDMVIVGLLATEWAERRAAIIGDLEKSCQASLPQSYWDRLRG